MNEQNNWIENEKEVNKQFCDYFTELFTTSRPTSDYISAALGDSAQTVTKEMNQQLDNPFLAKEIYTTMSQMSLIKVLGPDKLHVAFS